MTAMAMTGLIPNTEVHDSQRGMMVRTARAPMRITEPMEEMSWYTKKKLRGFVVDTPVVTSWMFACEMLGGEAGTCTVKMPMVLIAWQNAPKRKSMSTIS
jgi:hypothetical protein